MRTAGNVRGRLVVSASLFLTVLMGRDAYAQFSGNNQTNVISGISSNWAGTYIIGSNTFLDVLQILNGGVLASGGGTIGFLTGASNNSVLVSGSGSIWSNQSSVTIGDFDSGNSLVVSNGGLVYGNGQVSSANSSSSSNNLIVVTGANSVLKNIEMSIGSVGASNQLIIANGGVLFNSSDGRLGFSNSSKNNLVTVTGPGSLLSNVFGMYVAFSGVGNGLIISNGGAVVCNSTSFIGYDVHASNNFAIVTGTGSVWKILLGFSDLQVGSQGPQNLLVVTNGGAVFDNNGFIGAFSSGSNNTAIVTGPGSVWSNRANLSVGSGFGTRSNQLFISNGGAVFNNVGTINDVGGGSNQVVTVSGTGSVWSNSSDLCVGGGGPFNLLTLTNNGVVYNANAFMGFSNNSFSNTVFVGSGAVWNNARNLYVGYDGSGRLQCALGGTVIASNAYVGFNNDSVNNQILLSGSLFVTNAAHNAVLDVRCGQIILNGGFLQADILIITNVCGHLLNNGGVISYTQLILDPNLDADGDGILNGWEQSYGLDPLSTNGVNGANGDADHDGFSNLQEFLAGTDPTNASSAFVITSVLRTGNDVQVVWKTGVGKTNALQYSAGYNTNTFADLFIVTNTLGGTTNYLDVGAGTNSPSRFYRVRLVP